MFIVAARQAQSIVLKHTGIGGTCLVRSLTLWVLLLQVCIESDVLVGIRKRDGKIEGHAWVEYGGRPLNEDPAVTGTYTEFADVLSFDRIAQLRRHRFR
jgi:transglutaminase superfamily protein